MVREKAGETDKGRVTKDGGRTGPVEWFCLCPEGPWEPLAG